RIYRSAQSAGEVCASYYVLAWPLPGSLLSLAAAALRSGYHGGRVQPDKQGYFSCLGDCLELCSEWASRSQLLKEKCREFVAMALKTQSHVYRYISRFRNGLARVPNHLVIKPQSRRKTPKEHQSELRTGLGHRMGAVGPEVELRHTGATFQ